MNYLLCLQRLSVTLIFLCVVVNGRHIAEFDLDASAAEPRPTVIETGPSAEALPLVYSEDTSNNGPLSVASEKVEKVLRPAYSFAYNNKDDSVDDADVSESKIDNADISESKIDDVDEDQSSEAADYQHEKEHEKIAADKGETENEDAGIESEAAESKHHGHKHHGGGHGAKFEKAGGKDTHSHHHGEHGEKGDKGYKGHHHHEKGQKGHHDKEGHSKHYDEHGGHKKNHHHEDGYHGEYHKKHGGKKGGKYEEKGEHNKGHSTKGEHNIHKKEEYDKKTEFFEEENEGGESETHGGFKHEAHHEKGGHHKGSHKKGGKHEDHYGKKGESEKGGHYKDEKGHNEKVGHDKHHEHESKHGEKEGHAKGKKWAYKKGDGDGGGGGGGHRHGAHTHHTYAVQEPPKQEKPAEAVLNEKYQITPISAVVLPLEGETDDAAKEIEPEKSEELDDENSESILQELVVVKDHLLKDFKPSPRENTDDDLALISLPSDSQEVTQPPQESLTTLSTVERYIRQEMQKNRPKHLTLESAPKESKKVTKKYQPIKSTPEIDNSNDDLALRDPQVVTEALREELTTITTEDRYITQELQEDIQEHSTPESTPQETKNVTKKRRLKKRKISKATEANSRPSRNAQENTCNLQKREILVPEESSNSFVIVAAEDAL